LSAVTPVLVAILPEVTRWPAVLFSALVAIGVTSLKTFQYQENWINYRTTCETLRKEIHYYRAHLGDYRDAEDREAVFVEKIERLISRENTLWLSARLPKKEEAKSGG
jgi:hypothetical protein